MTNDMIRSIQRLLRAVGLNPRAIQNRLLNLEEVVDRWFRVWIGVVAAMLIAVVIRSRNEQNSWGFVVGSIGFILILMLLFALFAGWRERPGHVRISLLRLLVGSASLRAIGLDEADIAIRDRFLWKVFGITIAFIGLEILFIYVPIGGEIGVLGAWMVVAILLVWGALASPAGKARKRVWWVALLVAIVASIASAVVNEDAPLHQATVVVAEYTRGTVEVQYRDAPAPPPAPHRVPAGYNLIDYKVVPVTRSESAYQRLAWVENVEYWIDAPDCQSGVIRVESSRTPSPNEVAVSEMPHRIDIPSTHSFHLMGSGVGCNRIIYFAVVPAG
ncbi:hypothetical protein KKH05_03375 [Patescibacteria group bacterium]|nr:hypothetical protein [Patescibacteria group bacterium]